MTRTITLALCLALPLLAAAGGPWPQQRGRAFLKLSGWYLGYDQHYTDAGLLDPNITSRVYGTYLYGEYGITDRWTGLVNANLFGRQANNAVASATTREVDTPGEALNAFGDVELGLKYALTRPGAALPVAVSLVLGLPTGTPSAGAQGTLQTGDGEFNQLLRVDAGRSFRVAEGASGYLAAYAGFNHRTRGFSEELRLGAEAGLGLLGDRLYVIGRLDAVESLRNGNPTVTVNASGIFANNAEWLSLAGEVSYGVSERWGLSAGAATAVRGRVVAAGTSVTAGVWVKL